jgi:hypothetical protein
MGDNTFEPTRGRKRPIDEQPHWYDSVKIEIELVWDRPVGVLDEERLLALVQRMVTKGIPARIQVSGDMVPEETAIAIMLRRGQDPTPVVGYYVGADITEEQKQWYGYYEAGGE